MRQKQLVRTSLPVSCGQAFLNLDLSGPPGSGHRRHVLRHLSRKLKPTASTHLPSPNIRPTMHSRMHFSPTASHSIYILYILHLYILGLYTTSGDYDYADFSSSHLGLEVLCCHLSGRFSTTRANVKYAICQEGVEASMGRYGRYTCRLHQVTKLL